jgi:PAS domain S-box-containing protein
MPEPKRGWLVSVVPVFDEAQRVVQVALTLVPQAVAPYEEDAQKQSLFQAVFEQAVIGMTVIDWRDKGARTNAAMQQMLGYTAEEMAKLGVEGISHPDDYAIDLGHFHRVMLGEIDRYEMDKRFLHKDGRVIWAHLMVSMTRDAQGQPSLIISMAENINDRKQAEEERKKLQAQLLHAQKLESLGVLAGGIAHDFNNFLTAIMGSASVAQRNLPQSSEARADLDNVIDAAQRAASLTRQLVAYAGKGRFDVSVVDLSAQVRDLSGLLRTTISKRVELRLELASDLPAIKVDLSQLQQIIMNLVINGAEAIPDAKGHVVVTTGVANLGQEQVHQFLGEGSVSPGEHCFLEVRDTGSGMDEATQARIFDPFFTTKFAGRGLGLAAVLGIVRSHGGAIKVTSAPNQGTTFRVYFPTVAERVQLVRESRVEFRGGGVALVIDDDDSVRRAAARMLEALGFSVVQAEDGQRGIAAFSAEPGSVHLVLLDMTMPGLSGEETLQQLMQVRSDVPVVLVSGYPEVDALRRFGTANGVEFLQKPFSSHQLSSKLGKVLNRRHAPA